MPDRALILGRLQDVTARVLTDARALAATPARHATTFGFTFAPGEHVVDPITGEEGTIHAVRPVDTIIRNARPSID